MVSPDKTKDKFTGKELDKDIGLNYFGARYFDQDIGLWISPDPAGQFFSPYATSGNPVNFVDPDGLKEIDPCTDVGLGPGDWYSNDQKSMGDAMVYWANYADEKFMDNFAYGASQLAYWNMGGVNSEGGYLERRGRLLGAFKGASAATMGPGFSDKIKPGDRVFHLHTYQEYKQLEITKNKSDAKFGFSEGDLNWAKTNEMYVMEVVGGFRWFAGPGTMDLKRKRDSRLLRSLQLD